MTDYENLEPLNDPAHIFDISGRVGLVTGGAGKMGQQFAEVLIRAGARVIIADISDEICCQALKNIKVRVGSAPEFYICDVSDEASVGELFNSIQDKYGKLDFFISNVMAKPEGYYRSLESYSLSTWKEIHDINLGGTFLCCRKAAGLMQGNQSGSIVITSSIYGLVAPDLRIYEDCKPVKNPYGGSDALTAPGAYASSKGGLIALAKYLAILLAPKHIRVNTLVPGGVYDGQEENFHNAYINRTPLGRMAVWDDYNGAILFLVSDASRYMTGANLIVDGGWTAW